MEARADAFETWKSVCTHLEQTIQDYYDACVVLHDTLIVPSSDLSRQSREQTLIKIDQELLRYASFERILQKSRSHLCSVRNTSHMLSPISSLPTDVLHRVLTLATLPQDTNDGHGAWVTSLSSVCSAWRLLMMQSPTFWTFLKLDLLRRTNNASDQFTKLWVERSVEASLDLTICMPDDTGIMAIRLVPRPVIDSLVPLARCARTLQINNVSGHVVEILFQDILVHCTISRLISLDVYVHPKHGIINIPRPSANSTSSAGRGAPSHFFDSLRYLTVQGTWINCPGLVHAGLVELRLEHLYHWLLTLEKIVEILGAAPRLRILSVFHVNTGESSDQCGTVALNELETVRINKPELLATITSTSENIEAHLHVYDDTNLPAVCLFLAHTKISRLYLCTDDHEFFSLHSFLVPMHYLRVLCLDTITVNAETLQGAMEQLSSDIWPELDEIHLIDCVANKDALSLLASIHPPQTFTIASLINDFPEDEAEALDIVRGLLTDIGVKRVSAREGGLPTGFRIFES